MKGKFRAGQAGAEHDWVRLMEKFEDVPESLNVSEKIRKATLAELSCLVRLEDVKMRLMNELRGGCAPCSSLFVRSTRCCAAPCRRLERDL